MRVLLAIVAAGGVTGSCSLGFAVSMLRLQAALLADARSGVQAVLQVLPGLKDAAAAAKDFDALVAVSPLVAFPVALVTRALTTRAPFVTGVYPLPRLDWDRVKARADDTREAMRFKGNTYNIEAADAVPTEHAGYMAVKTASLGAVVLSKEAIEALAACTGSSDQDLCKAWGKDILADLDQPCATIGPIEFTGCVGLRAVPKKT